MRNKAKQEVEEWFFYLAPRLRASISLPLSLTSSTKHIQAIATVLPL